VIPLFCFAVIYGLRHWYWCALIIAIAMWSLTGFYMYLN
jgi:hypothetical protein